VQQNSATAEESAAASEEMSGQANMLEELISQFKLKSTAQRRVSAGDMREPIAMPEKAVYVTPKGEFGKY
ncbi:MAG: hypothetical protein LBR85_07290, partial [Oscillospiraceae bacterium]|nr:hypothetical protein [Oscillospiraceae bacterium]